MIRLKPYTDISSKMKPLTKKDLLDLRQEQIDKDNKIRDAQIHEEVYTIYELTKTLARKGEFECVKLVRNVEIVPDIVKKLSLLFPESKVTCTTTDVKWMTSYIIIDST